MTLCPTDKFFKADFVYAALLKRDEYRVNIFDNDFRCAHMSYNCGLLLSFINVR